MQPRQQHSQLVNIPILKIRGSFSFSVEELKCAPLPHITIILLKQFWRGKKHKFYSFMLKLLIFSNITGSRSTAFLKEYPLETHIHPHRDHSFVMFLPVNMPLTIAKGKTTRNFQTHFHADSSGLPWLSFLSLPHRRLHLSAAALGEEGRLRIAR